MCLYIYYYIYIVILRFPQISSVCFPVFGTELPIRLHNYKKSLVNLSLMPSVTQDIRDLRIRHRTL